jgi:ubiquinone/menaquinone biosynthesis C-methylase UbiE
MLRHNSGPVGTMPSSFVGKGADNYEASMGRWSRQLATPFLDFAGVPSGGRVLDAGCGTGSLTLALAAHHGLEAIDALDFAEDFVAALRARANDPRIRARQGDVCSLPYDAGSFEAVYSLLVLHFVSDPHRAIGEMRRVLRPGGLAAATVWATGGMPSWRLFWDTVLVHEPTAEAVAPARRPLTGGGELRMAFERAGFRQVVETTLTISMDFADFSDFWYPTAYGQGRFGAFFDALPEERRNRLRDAVEAAYCAGEPEGPRSFQSTAFAVRCIA